MYQYSTMRLRIRSLVLAVLLWSDTAMPASPPASRSGSFHLDLPPAGALLLFTADGERTWAPGWDPQMLSGDVERGSVFRTRSHGNDVVWIVTAYDKETHSASYARLVEGMNMGLVDVTCAAEGDGTRVTVRYTLTPLSEPGERQVAHMLEARQYAAFMEEWRQAIAATVRRDDAN